MYQFLSKKKITGRELASQSGVKARELFRYHSKLSGLMKKAKIDGLYHYWIPDSERDYVRKYLMKKFGGEFK